MPHTRKDLGVVKIYAQKTWYTIKCEKPKIERKQEINLRTACDSHTPYEANPGGVEYTVELPGVAQHQAWIFRNIMKRQETGRVTSNVRLAVFKYTEDGKLYRDWYLGDVYFESMSQEGNEPVDMKGGALINYDN